MLELTAIDAIAAKAASAVLNLPRVIAHSEPAIDSGGDDALVVMLVLPTPGYTAVDGASALDTIVRIRHELVDAGEERFPIVEFATVDDLAADADSES